MPYESILPELSKQSVKVTVLDTETQNIWS